MSRNEWVLIVVAGGCVVVALLAEALPYAVWLAVVGILVGGAISFLVALIFYIPSARSLERESERLRRHIKGIVEGRHMRQTTWSKKLTDSNKLDHLKLVYDYVKFHIQLYLATPAVLVLVAEGLQVKQYRIFTFGLIGMILVYLAAGIHAGLFMGRHVNDPRQVDFLKRFEQDAFSSGRRFMHHFLYWLGLAIGVGCLGLSAARKYL
jgi:hypothetical protein